MGVTITDYGTGSFNTEVRIPSAPSTSSVLVTSLKPTEIDFSVNVQGLSVQLITKGSFDSGLINLLPTSLEDVISSGLSTSVTNVLFSVNGQASYSMAINPGISLRDLYNLLRGASASDFSPLSGNDTYNTNNVAINSVTFLYGGNDTFYQNHLTTKYNDMLYGGDGTDTIVYQGKSSDFLIAYTSKGIWDDLNQKTGLEGFTITDKNGVINTAQVNQVEKIQFSDKTVDLAPFLSSAQQGEKVSFFGIHTTDTFYNPANSGAPKPDQIKVTNFTSTEIDTQVYLGSTLYSTPIISGLFDISLFKLQPSTFADIVSVANSNPNANFFITGLSSSLPNDPQRTETYNKALTISQFMSWVYPTSNLDYQNFFVGNDSIYTSSNGDDSSSSAIYTYVGDDSFYESQKLIKYNDTFYGGAGTDTLVYSAKSTGFSIVSSNYVWDAQSQKSNLTGFIVTNTAKAINTVQINQVEKIQFSDFTLDTTMLTKTAALAHSQIVSLTQLYIASFNRAPDSVGLYYWGSRLSDGMSLQDIANSFFVQPETIAAYPTTMATSDFVTRVYNNVLSRAPDSDGLKYWVSELTTGRISKDSFLLAIINGAQASTGSAIDRQTLSNKEAVGEHYAIFDGLNNSTNWAKDVMSGVSDLASTVTSANAKADFYATMAANPLTSDLIVKMIGIAL